MSLAIKGIFVLFVLLQILNLAFSIHEDQDGLYDWHKQQIGRVKFVEFNTNGQRKRVYVATEKNVLASLTLRTGEIAWRQFLGENDPISALHSSSKIITTLSSNGKFLRAWSTIDGSLFWETTVPSNSDSSSSNSHLIFKPEVGSSWGNFFVLSGGKIFCISGGNGDVLWESKIENSSPSVRLVGENLIAVSTTSGKESTSFKISFLEVGSGEETFSKTLNLPLKLTKEKFFIGDDFLVVLDPKTLKFHTLPLKKSSLSFTETAFEGLKISAETEISPTKISGRFVLKTDEFVAILEFSKRGKLQVVTKLEGNSILSDSLSLEDGKSAIAVISQFEEKNGSVVKLQTLVGGEKSGEDFLEIPLHRGRIQKVHLNSYTKRDGGKYGFRFLLIGEDDSFLLAQQGSIVFEREEALASIVASQIIDLPAANEGVTAVAIEHSLEDWFKNQWLKTKRLLNIANSTELEAVRESELNNWDKNAPSRDHYGFRRLILALSETGKIFGLHSGDGRVLFSSLLPSLQSSSHISPPGRVKINEFLVLKSGEISKENPELLIVSHRVEKSTESTTEKGFLVKIEGLSGKEIGSYFFEFPISLVIQLPYLTKSGVQPVLLVEGTFQETSPLVHVFPETEEAVQMVQSRSTDIFFYIVEKEKGSVSGFKLGNKLQEKAVFDSLELWKFVFPKKTEKISTIAVRRADEHVHTQTRSKADRGVQYKYLNKNLIFLATETPPKPGKTALNPEESSIVVQILDSVTGRVVHKLTHPKMTGPVKAVFSENWVVYHYFNLKFHRFEMSVLELYDTAEQASGLDIVKYALGLGGGHLSSPLSSWSQSKVEVLHQTYFFSHSVNTMAVTSTARGITAKQVLLGLSSGQIIALDKRLLDPRRTLTLTPQEREEGITPYSEALPVNPAAFLTHGVPIEGLKEISTAPARLESTTLVFAHGIDLFYIRTAPSRMFDTLTEDFNYVLLLVTIISLFVAIGVSFVLGERRELKLKWK